MFLLMNLICRINFIKMTKTYKNNNVEFRMLFILRNLTNKKSVFSGRTKPLRKNVEKLFFVCAFLTVLSYF